MVKGWLWRQEREEDRLAVLVCTLANASGNLKHPMRVRDFLGGRDLGMTRVPGWGRSTLPRPG